MVALAKVIAITLGSWPTWLAAISPKCEHITPSGHNGHKTRLATRLSILGQRYPRNWLSCGAWAGFLQDVPESHFSSMTQLDRHFNCDEVNYSIPSKILKDLELNRDSWTACPDQITYPTLKKKHDKQISIKSLRILVMILIYNNFYSSHSLFTFYYPAHISKQ